MTFEISSYAASIAGAHSGNGRFDSPDIFACDGITFRGNMEMDGSLGKADFPDSSNH
ncbi:MAG: hypothetical protein R3F48_12490 [Candidatus Zixiibacteriota bacterium]